MTPYEGARASQMDILRHSRLHYWASAGSPETIACNCGTPCQGDRLSSGGGLPYFDLFPRTGRTFQQSLRHTASHLPPQHTHPLL